MTGTAYLEQALIGALLNNPAAAGRLPRLTETDFTDQLCRAIWPLLTGSTPALPGPVNVADIALTLDQSRGDLHPRIRSTATIAELQINAPARPHPSTYARLIIDATARREIVSLGYRLTQLNPDHPDDVDSLNKVAYQLRRATNRIQPAGSIPSTANTIDPDRHPVTTYLFPDLAEQQAAVSADPDRAAAEWAILGALIHDHPAGTRQLTQARLTEADLSLPHSRNVWAAVAALQHASTPVDEITVFWQLTHADDGRPIPLDQLRRSRDAAPAAAQCVHDLIADSMARAVAQSLNTLDAYALTGGPTRSAETQRLIVQLERTTQALHRSARHEQPSLRLSPKPAGPDERQDTRTPNRTPTSPRP